MARDKRIKISDEELSKMVQQDIEQASSYFDTNRKGEIIQRYHLLNAAEEYYEAMLPGLQDKCKFTTTDIRDAVEWTMPGLIDVFLGAEDIASIRGRGKKDNPDALKKIIRYQIRTQNRGYKILTQAIRDSLEAGLGVVKGYWMRRESKKKKTGSVDALRLNAIPSKVIKKIKARDDGMYDVTVEIPVREKDQPCLVNVKPGEYIYIPIRNEDDRLVFEAHRQYMLVDDLRVKEKDGLFRNVDKLNPLMDTPAGESAIDEIYRAMTDGSEVDQRESYSITATKLSKEQSGKQLILVHECYGYYDVNGDGLLEEVIVWWAGGQVLAAWINDIGRSVFAKYEAFARSYQEWKIGMADFLQSTQDGRTALIRQIIINTAINNDKQIAIDKTQKQAYQDFSQGMKLVGMDLSGNKSIKDFIQELPDRTLAKETFLLMGQLQQDGEKKTGVSEHFQGLDRGGIHKTADGVNMIMTASQQRQKMVIHNIAETGMVDTISILIRLNQLYLDRNVAIRIADEYFEFTKDDINGNFDVEVSSSASMESPQYRLQSLMILFNQVVPTLLQMGIATPMGIYKTADMLIKQIGFQTPTDFIGRSEQELMAMFSGMQQQQINNAVVQAAGQALMQAGMAPEQAAQLTQAIMQNLNSPPQQQQQQTQPTQQQTPGGNENV